jgi:hypothetical protein
MNGMISMFAIVFSFLALLVSIAAIVIVLAMKWSTHKIEWKPLKMHDPLSEPEEELEEIAANDDKLLEKALNLQKKKKKESDPLDSILETNNF